MAGLPRPGTSLHRHARALRRNMPLERNEIEDVCLDWPPYQLPVAGSADAARFAAQGPEPTTQPQLSSFEFSASSSAFPQTLVQGLLQRKG